MGLITIITLVGIAVAGLAAILAIFMERDPRRPMKFAVALSALILMATAVTILQSVLDARDEAEREEVAKADKEKLEGDLARMMQTLDKLAAESEDPQLQAFLATELEAQARSNPEVVQKLAQRFADEGEDPAEKLGAHMKSSEVEKIARKGGLKTKKKKTSAKTEVEKKEEKAPARPKKMPMGLGRPGIGPGPGLGADDDGDGDAPAPPPGGMMMPAGMGSGPGKGPGLGGPMLGPKGPEGEEGSKAPRGGMLMGAPKKPGDGAEEPPPAGKGPGMIGKAPAPKDAEADDKAEKKKKKKKKSKKSAESGGLGAPKLGL